MYPGGFAPQQYKLLCVYWNHFPNTLVHTNKRLYITNKRSSLQEEKWAGEWSDMETVVQPTILDTPPIAALFRKINQIQQIQLDVWTRIQWFVVNKEVSFSVESAELHDKCEGLK